MAVLQEDKLVSFDTDTSGMFTKRVRIEGRRDLKLRVQVTREAFAKC